MKNDGYSHVRSLLADATEYVSDKSWWNNLEPAQQRFLSIQAERLQVLICGRFRTKLMEEHQKKALSNVNQPK